VDPSILDCSLLFMAVGVHKYFDGDAFAFRGVDVLMTEIFLYSSLSKLALAFFVLVFV
jgi:hypothetical protein